MHVRTAISWLMKLAMDTPLPTSTNRYWNGLGVLSTNCRGCGRFGNDGFIDGFAAHGASCALTARRQEPYNTNVLKLLATENELILDHLLAERLTINWDVVSHTEELSDSSTAFVVCRWSDTVNHEIEKRHIFIGLQSKRRIDHRGQADDRGARNLAAKEVIVAKRLAIAVLCDKQV